MVSNLDGARDRGQKQTDVIIVDFPKAFDKVPHRTLLCKIDHYGIRGSTDVDQLMALWALSKSGVGWSSLRSSPGPIWCPSWFGLRPNPFFIFINDLPDNIRSSVRLFAGDCVLYRCNPPLIARYCKMT